MSHSVKIYDTCNRYSQCVRACLIVVPEMIPWDGCKAKGRNKWIFLWSRRVKV